MDNTNIEYKVGQLLEFYLSLHEADEIYNMIFKEDASWFEIENKLKEFRDNPIGWGG
jgi:hypothetical protein